VRKLETGERTPTPEQLSAIASACDIPPEFFAIDFRALADPVASQAAQLAEISDRLARIEAELGIRRSRRLPNTST
jgi:transcriptional regulator with XRE-family HTH domain